MYSEPEPPSRAERSEHARAPRRWRHGVAWVLAVGTFALASVYAVGGRDWMGQLIRRGREMQTQAAAALQPPTQAALRRAPPDTASAAVRTQSDTPVSAGLVATWIGSILIVVVAMFYLTGHPSRKRARD